MSLNSIDLGRRRSRFVFDRAARWGDSDRKDITSKAQGLPVTLRSQGLVVTMARLAAGTDIASETLNGMLVDWLTGGNPLFKPKGKVTTAKGLLKQLMEEPRATYLAVQREALALAERIKLISKAFFSEEEADLD